METFELKPVNGGWIVLDKKSGVPLRLGELQPMSRLEAQALTDFRNLLAAPQRASAVPPVAKILVIVEALRGKRR